MKSALEDVKDRIWFYEFDLPDGARTKTDIPDEVLRIHTSRRDKLRAIIEGRVSPKERATAIDFASHEGYFSIELAKHFQTVIGLEVREQSLAAARLMTSALMPEPQVASLLQGNPYSLFAQSAHPTNMMFSPPRRDPNSLGWVFCFKADVNAIDGSPMETQTYLVHVEQGSIGRRGPAEPGDGCDSDSYHRLGRAVVTSTPPNHSLK